RANGTGCPFCCIRGSAKQVCPHNCVAATHPQLLGEWRIDIVQPSPRDLSYGSGERIHWRCKVDPRHTWRARVKNRTKSEPTGCPHCAAIDSGIGYSQVAIRWIDEIAAAQNLAIQHAENGGEFYIPGPGRADGYCAATNT